MKNEIKRYREALGMTQSELGDRVGASRQAIHALETGKNEPSIWLAYAIAQTFGTKIEDVFLFEQSHPRSRAESSGRRAYGA